VAQKVRVLLVDDLDGTEAETTVEFGLDGVSYTIDLSADNAESLREALAPYVDSGHRIGERKKSLTKTATAAAPSAATGREQTQAIREWARKQGYDVSDRGRIPGHIGEAYEKAHRGKRKR
jgi:hypothetical protein